MPTNPNTAEPGKPRRRWFQFRLRTLLIGLSVVAVPFAYAGQQYKIVRERQAWLKSDTRPWGGPCDRYMEGEPKVWSDGDQDIKPSFIRRWLGDESHEVIRLHREATNADIEHVKQLFPEAEIIQYFGEPRDTSKFKFEPMAAPTDPRSPFEVANPNALPPKLP